MKSFYLLFLWALVSCTQTNAPQKGNEPLEVEHSKTENNCDTLSVIVSQTDTFDYEADSQYGVGDDDLFTANDPKIYKINNGKWNDISNILDDYNLTTSVDLLLNNKNPDTFCIVVKFPGLTSLSNIDTLGLVNSIAIFNGKRTSVSYWKKSGKVKEIELLHNGLSQGCTQLINTYKYQTVNFKKPIALLKGKSDTFSIIVKSTYPISKIELQKYSISEIKLEGERRY